MEYRKTFLTASALIAIIILAETCMDKPAPAVVSRDTPQIPAPQPTASPATQPPAYTDYAGSAKCTTCHKQITQSFFHTAHHLSTQPASAAAILGSFEKGNNAYVYDSTHTVAMEKRPDGFYQAGYLEGRERVARRIDIVVGSGTKGQTYITRNNNELYQLPVSYFTIAHQWANSPLYPRSPVLFNRAISARCLECHSTFVKQLTFSENQQETFDANQIVYGVGCEKCHGPAAKHVAFHTAHPNEKTAHDIISATAFSRQQQLDLCGLCHGGRLQKTRPSFSYVPGSPLTDYFTIDTTARPDPENIDVHGNQLGLLRASKCFRQSGTLTCTSCHDPHRNERANLAVLSQRCINCHGGSHDNGSPGHDPVCKLTKSIGPSITANCIDCHMPLRPSLSITELLPGHTTATAAMIRSHLIKIYPRNAQ